MTLVNQTIKTFTAEVASCSPAPGGGSIAALCGALGSALCHMAASLTLGKKNFKDVEPFMVNLKKTAKTLQKKLLDQVEEDSLAYNRVMDAFKLQKETPEQQEFRKQVIQDALKAAAWVPYISLETAAQAMVLVEDVLEKGNPNCITDAGVAAEVINAAVQGAAYNVCINLLDIKDDGFTLDLRKKVVTVKRDISDRTNQIRKTIEQAIHMET